MYNWYYTAGVPRLQPFCGIEITLKSAENEVINKSTCISFPAWKSSSIGEITSEKKPLNFGMELGGEESIYGALFEI